jgi:cysteine synthase
VCGEVGRHLIEGISDGFVPGIFARHGHIIDGIVAVDSDAAISEMRRLARESGLFAGPSSGAHLLSSASASKESRAAVLLHCAGAGQRYWSRCQLPGRGSVRSFVQVAGTGNGRTLDR